MEKIVYENGTKEIRDDYTKLFYTNLPLRPSCGVCKFASQERVGDFTVGDFWGVQSIFPEFNDEKGVSIVLINSGRGLKIFNEIEDELELMETDIRHAMQPNLIAPTKIPPFKKLFWKDFKRKGVLYCAEKWIPIIEFPIVLKAKVKKLLKG